MNYRRHSVHGGQFPLKCDSFPALLEKAAEAASVTTTSDNVTSHTEVYSGSDTKRFQNSQWRMVPIWIKCRKEIQTAE